MTSATTRVISVAETKDNAGRCEQQRILDFWFMVEMFSPQQTPRLDRRNGVVNLIDEEEPWGNSAAPVRKRIEKQRQSMSKSPSAIFQHRVHLGMYSIADVYREVEKVYPPDPDSYEERNDTECTMAFLIIDDTGKYVPDSFVLSTAAWAVGQLSHSPAGVPLYKKGFDAAEASLAETVERMLVRTPSVHGDDSISQVNGVRKAMDADVEDNTYGERAQQEPIRAEELRSLLTRIAHSLGISDTLSPKGVRVDTVSVSTKSTDVEPQFLNSFYLKDLASLAPIVPSLSQRSAIRRYLMPNDCAAKIPRVDVHGGLDEVYRGTRPESIPLGRWPAKETQPLVLSQQFAVNSILDSLSGNPGIVGVNGPPGTGKTTMLRDLMADLIVRRAIKLMTLEKPAQAFASKPLISKFQDHRYVAYPLRPEFSGFEIVLASANNGAVENVSMEIPRLDAIDEQWHELAGDVDYFQDLGSAILNTDDRGQKAWGLLSARLGNKGNCSKFAERFYWQKTGREDGVPSGMYEALKKVDQSTIESWADAKSRFSKALQASKFEQQARQRLFDATAEIKSLTGELSKMRRESAAVEAAIAEAKHEVDDCQFSCDHWCVELNLANDQRRLHQAQRPGLWTTILSFGKDLRRWNERDQKLASVMDQAEDQQREAHANQYGLEMRERDLKKEYRRIRGRICSQSERKKALEQICVEAQGWLGDSFPKSEWWSASARKSRECGNLWTDKTWNHARSALFLEALRLQKSFILHNAGTMRKNLGTAVGVMKGVRVDDQVAYAAWQSFFLTVPVVSTTFASFARLFSGVGHQQLGWLLIDEAGQASPQQAAGAIYRAKHAVVVGDPNQLEPITSMPFKAEQAIRQGFELDEQWLVSKQSAQRLADRATEWGTYLPDPVSGENSWVGLPLVVHRRCDDPMFSICNEIAYNDTMVMGTSEEASKRFRESHPRLPPSKWIHVPSTMSSGNWVPAETEQLCKILDCLRDKLAFDMSDVLVICPFRDVARQVNRLVQQSYKGLKAGTIHTAQGKEASIVILVLGGDPGKPGAKNWASKSANLLNVAVSRAKRRLYVIGDQEKWKECRFFGILSTELSKNNKNSVA